VEGDDERKRSEVYSANLSRVYSACMKSMSFSIDDDMMDRESFHCEFYQHSNSGERGFMCFLPIDSLSLGRHLLEYKMISLEEDVIDTLSYYVPFFKY